MGAGEIHSPLSSSGYRRILRQLHDRPVLLSTAALGATVLTGTKLLQPAVSSGIFRMLFSLPRRYRKETSNGSVSRVRHGSPIVYCYWAAAQSARPRGGSWAVPATRLQPQSPRHGLRPVELGGKKIVIVGQPSVALPRLMVRGA